MAEHRQAFLLKKKTNDLSRYEAALKKSGLGPYAFNYEAVMKEVKRLEKKK